MNRISLSVLCLAVCAGFATSGVQAGDLESIRACLSRWGNHPFNANNPQFRTYSKKVRVFGLGGKVSDTTPTSHPSLVLISPNVSVMSKTTMELLNPNGWYCLRGKVNVLSSTTIKLHCRAHLASTSSGTTVLGGGNSAEVDHETTVLGGARINRVGCDGATPASTPVSRPRKSDEVRQAQAKLAALGYAPGPADGMMGGRTSRAIEAYQRDANLPVSGKLDQQTQASLEQASPKASVGVASTGAGRISDEMAKPDLVERLRELNELKQEGVISEEEFQALKQKTIEKY